MGSNGDHKTGLELSLGSNLDDHTENDNKNKKKKSVIITSLKYDHLFPSDLRLGRIGIAAPARSDGPDHPTSPDRVLHRQASSLSSFSNSSASTTPIVIKRDMDVISGEEPEPDLQRRVISGRSNDDREDIDEEQGSPRKKLRLKKQQSALLEDSFKHHTTLNPKQKQELARELNLRPRQVEVWFQNRRARNKLKQTEADYKQRKECCETLTEENKRLQKELQELRSLKLIATPFYTPFANSSSIICPSCQRLSPSATNNPIHFIPASFTPS